MYLGCTALQHYPSMQIQPQDPLHNYYDPVNTYHDHVHTYHNPVHNYYDPVKYILIMILCIIITVLVLRLYSFTALSLLADTTTRLRT